MEENKPFRIDPDRALKLYADMVYRLCLINSSTKENAEDSFQEVFVKLISCGKEFESEEHLKAWLIRVTVNQCRSTYSSSHWNRLQLLDDNAGIDPETSVTPDAQPDSFEQTDRKIILGQALETLSPEDRMLIHLFYYEELGIEEISGCLKMSSSLVRVRLHRSRNRLRKYFEERGFDYEDL